MLLRTCTFRYLQSVRGSSVIDHQYGLYGIRCNRRGLFVICSK